MGTHVRVSNYKGNTPLSTFLGKISRAFTEAALISTRENLGIGSFFPPANGSFGLQTQEVILFFFFFFLTKPYKFSGLLSSLFDL